jgi:anti-sigma B factor antagonist
VAEKESDMDLRLRTVRREGVAVVELGGELELHNASLLREELAALCAVEKPSVIVDLSMLTFMDSTGIGVLVQGFKAARARSGTLALVCPSQRLMRLFEIAGLTSALLFFGDRADAEVSMRESRSTSGSSASAQPVPPAQPASS